MSGIGSLGPFDADTAAIVPALPGRRSDSDLDLLRGCCTLDGGNKQANRKLDS